MQKVLHRSGERGKGDYGWLTTRYSFSFADWYNPARMGFGVLRVINDDRVAPGKGFDMHGHRDMEIITIVTAGSVTHTDSMGNTGVVPAGDVQVMSAGTGVVHAEQNTSKTEDLALFQIWIEPHEMGVQPRYAQQSFEKEKTRGMTLLVAPEESEGGLRIHQDAYIYRAVLGKNSPTHYTLKSPTHGVYAFVVEGDVTVAGEMLGPRDAIGVWESESITLESSNFVELLLIEVPMR